MTDLWSVGYFDGVVAKKFSITLDEIIDYYESMRARTDMLSVAKRVLDYSSVAAYNSYSNKFNEQFAFFHPIHDDIRISKQPAYYWDGVLAGMLAHSGLTDEQVKEIKLNSYEKHKELIMNKVELTILGLKEHANKIKVFPRDKQNAEMIAAIENDISILSDLIDEMKVTNFSRGSDSV